MQKMRIGDVIITSPFDNWSFQNIVSKIIAKVCKGTSHVGIYCGFGRMAHLDLTGMKIDKLSEYFKERKIHHIYHSKLSTWQKVKLYWYLWLWRKQKYSPQHLLRLLYWQYKPPKQVKNTLQGYAVCSTFVAFMLDRVGKTLRTPIILTTPADYIRNG